jgi:hypothetical protein
MWAVGRYIGPLLAAALGVTWAWRKDQWEVQSKTRRALRRQQRKGGPLSVFAERRPVVFRGGPR